MLLACVALAACPCPERYYAVYFAAESVPHRLRNTHTFATYVRVSAAGVRPVTVSWLSADGVIRPFGLAEVGRNRTLGESLAYAGGRGWTVTAYGPFAIDAGRYARAEAFAGTLASGAIKYRATDGFRLRNTVYNCVSAVRAVERPPADDGYWPTRVGTAGTSDIVRELLAAGAIAPAPEAAWLLPALGVRGR